MKNSDMTTDLLTAVQTEPTITSSQVRCEETNLTKSLIDGTNATMAGLKLKTAENSVKINQQISVITTTSNEIEDQEKDTSQKEKSEKRKPYGGRPLRFQCPDCDRRFHAPSHLKRHMLCHSSERPFQCKICQKGFLQAWHLGRHMTTHTGNKPFSCPECPKTFGSRFEMKTHCNYIHKGIKEHECNVCKKLFTLRSNLKVHMRKHTGEKPYECNICGKKFGQRGHLQYHLKKHTSEKRSEEPKVMRNLVSPDNMTSSHVSTLVESPNINYDSGVESSDSEKVSSRPASPTYLSDKQKERSLSYQLKASQIKTENDSMTSFKRGSDILSTIPLSGRIFDHTNPKEIKPYVCESCNCGFAEINSLRAHVRHSHPKKGIYNAIYSCAYCNRAFHDIEYLRQHFYYDHTVRPRQEGNLYVKRSIGQKYKSQSEDNTDFISKRPSMNETKTTIFYRSPSAKSTSSEPSNDFIPTFGHVKSPSSYSVSSDITYDRKPSVRRSYSDCGPHCTCRRSFNPDRFLADVIEKRYMYHLEQYQKFLESHASLMDALKYKKCALIK